MRIYMNTCLHTHVHANIHAYVHTHTREILQAEVSESSARQCDEVQFKAKQSNVNQGNVKHEAIHMHVRRKVTQRNTMQRNAKIPSNPRIPGNSEIPKKDPGEPKLMVASAIGSLSRTKGGRREDRIGKRRKEKR